MGDVGSKAAFAMVNWKKRGNWSSLKKRGMAIRKIIESDSAALISCL